MSKQNNNIILGLDIGSTSVKIAAADLIDAEISKGLANISLEISSPLTKNSFDIDSLKQTIRKGIEQIENQLAMSFDSEINAVITLPLHYYESKIRNVSLDIDNIVKYDHKLELINKVKEKYSSGIIMHTIPFKYYLDDQEIKNPIGRSGIELSADIYVIYYDEYIFEQCKKMFNDLNINVGKYVAPPLSFLNLCQSNLVDKVKKLIVIDCGGNSSYLYYIYNGSLVKFEAVQVGSDSITNDISIVLKIDRSYAELFKINESSLSKQSIGEDLAFNGKLLSRQMLNAVVTARYEEIIELLEEKIELDIINFDSEETKFLLLGNGHPQGAKIFFKERWQIEELSSNYIKNKLLYITALGNISYSTNNEIFVPDLLNDTNIFDRILKFFVDLVKLIKVN